MNKRGLLYIKAMLIADLSIDFDFFTREEESWGFQCDDSPYHALAAWESRYAERDLRSDSCIDRYADFAPEDLLRALEEKGLRLLTQRQRRFGVADSHHFAHEFFASSSRAADLVLNIDAHHDLFAAEDEMTCGNWATYFVAQHPNVRYQQIYPSWKGPEEDDVPSVNAEFHQWGSWRGFTSAEDVRIRHIFLCRSAGWVAPHHDGRFLKVVEALGEIAEPEYLEGVEVRQAPWLFGRATRERAESRRVARIGR